MWPSPSHFDGALPRWSLFMWIRWPTDLRIRIITPPSLLPKTVGGGGTILCEEYVVSEFTSNLIVSRCRSCGDFRSSLFLLCGGAFPVSWISTERSNQVVQTALPCSHVCQENRSTLLDFLFCFCFFWKCGASVCSCRYWDWLYGGVLHWDCTKESLISWARLKIVCFKETAGRCRNTAS